MKAQSVKTKNVALSLCVTAMFSALLVGGKEALAALPNVEVVTLLIAVCAYVWGLAVAVPAVCAFILCDMAIWGVNTWLVSYVIHWNAVAVLFFVLSKFRLQSKVWQIVLATVAAVFVTACFGVLTTAVDTAIGFANGFYWDFENFAQRFAIMYTAGTPFFVTHIVANAVLFPVAFLPLVIVNKRARLRLFPLED